VLAVYGRPLTWGMLILVAVGVLLIMSTVSLAGAWWAWHHLAAQVVLTEQTADIRLPGSLQVQARVERHMQVKVDQVIPVTVPIQQTLNLPIRESLPVQITLDTMVPVSVDVPVKQILKLDQVVRVDTQVRTKVLGFPMTLPIQGDVPIRAEVPIELTIPIRHQLPVALLTTATVQLEAPLKADIDTVVRAQVPFKQQLSLPVSAPVDAVLRFTDQHVQAGLNLMTLLVPFDAVTLLPRAPRSATTPAPTLPGHGASAVR
jgi:hypothetical protein